MPNIMLHEGYYLVKFGMESYTWVFGSFFCLCTHRCIEITAIRNGMREIDSCD